MSAHATAVQVPAPIHVRLGWRPGIRLAAGLRERLHREIESLTWEISQAEALMVDLHRVAGDERAWLMPRIELRVPIYDQNRRFRVCLSHLEKPRILLVDEEGKRLADVIIV